MATKKKPVAKKPVAKKTAPKKKIAAKEVVKKVSIKKTVAKKPVAKESTKAVKKVVSKATKNITKTVEKIKTAKPSLKKVAKKTIDAAKKTTKKEASKTSKTKKVKKIKVEKEVKPKKERKTKVKTPVNDRTDVLAERFQLIQDVKVALQKQDNSGEAISLDLADKLKKLLALGKTQGFLTHDQINENIDSDIDPRRLDRILDIITEFKIHIVEKEEDLGEVLAVKDDEKSQKRSEDSVKTYLKSMSTVKLLTREDEVAIAMRIEEGRNKTVRSIYQSPIIMRHFIEWYNGLVNGTILLRDIIRIDET